MSNAPTITVVNTSNGWAVCQTNDDGTQLFILPDIIEPQFSEEHAKLVADTLKHHLENGGHTYAKPLPAGVTIIN